MRNASIIPLVRLPRGLDEFDYAIPDDMNETCLPGTFVSIPFRGSRVPGLVTARGNENSAQLKSIERVLPLAFPSWDVQCSFSEWFARNYCISKATALKTLFPSFPALFLSHGTYKEHLNKKKQTFELQWHIANTPLPDSGTPSALFFSHSIQERYDMMIAILRESAHNRKSALILFPTIRECQLFEPYARLVFGENVVILHSGLAPTALFARWAALFEQTPRCVLATRIGVGIPLHTLDTVIIDSSDRIEHNQYDLNPRFDARDCAWHAAHLRDARLVSISSAPRLEDYALLVGKFVCPEKEFLNDYCTIIDMKNELRARGRGYISETLVEQIAAALKQKNGVFLFLNRTGTSRMLTCRDCGHMFSCPSCSRPLSTQHALLVCNHCKKEEPSPRRCPSCHSVRFRFIALGTEKIAELMKQQFPHVLVREITQKNSSPESLANLDLSSTIIIGTSYFPLSYPERFRTVGLIGVLAADPVISLSDFRSEERQIQLLFHLASLARSVNAQLIVQTFSPKHKSIQALASGDYCAFADAAIHERSLYGWPPHTRLIRLRRSRMSSQQTRGSSDEKIQCIIQECTAHGLTIRSKNDHEILLSLKQQALTPGSELPKSLQCYLMALPADWLIDIDPVIL